MASNRNTYQCIYSALVGIADLDVQEPANCKADNPDAVSYLSQLDEFYQQSEDQVYRALLEQCKDIDFTKNVEEEIQRLLEQDKFTFDLEEDITAEDEAALSLRISYLLTERVIPHLIHLQSQIQPFLEAVINNDRKTVSRMLNNTELTKFLLHVSPPEDMVIENALTRQKFYAENALTMAVKRKQFMMIYLLLSFYDQFDETDDIHESKQQALSAWQPYEIQKNAEDEDEIFIPKEYTAMAESLIDVFGNETFPNGIPGENDIPRNIELSDKTELALSSLLNLLIPKTAVTLDNHVDEELLLLAIHKAYRLYSINFDCNADNLEAFYFRVIGLIQSALIPETGEIYSDGLDEFEYDFRHEKVRETSNRSRKYKLRDGELFYRASRDSRSGNGFDFMCTVFGSAWCGLTGNRKLFGLPWTLNGSSLENYLKQKQIILGQLCSGIEPSPANQPSLHKG